MTSEGSVQFKGFTPYLYYEDAAAALEFLSQRFGFEEVVRYLDADDVVREAEMRAGDTVIMLAGVDPGYWEKQSAPGPVGHLCIVYVDDVDAHWERVKAAGLDVAPPEDKPYGARVYGADDIGGHSWSFWQVLPEEVKLDEGWRVIRPQETRDAQAEGASTRSGG